ncbi:hypothetical protein C8D77_11162 [Mesorhizobium loti]|uniref:Uncharacterized protein n=1 Tax=Rhizobium loti TaxID=381 RepID=A0A8E2WB65_RHILI|nr:hypothetical protein [Mesorhizobium loti]PWJ88340.1 hypothetical protein C8D77_11162 [Mesorhizobium loti]
MIDRFDILLVALLVYFGDKVTGSRLPQQMLNIAILVTLFVLLLLGVARA